MNNNKEKFKKNIEKIISYYNKQNFKLAIEKSELLLQNYPNNTFLHNILGSSLKNLGQPKKAKDIFIKSLEIDKNNLATINNLANTLRKMSDFDNAEYYYKTALDIDSNHIDTIVNYGSLNFELNDLNKAIALFKRALDINSEVFQAQYNLALAYQSLGSFTEAKSHFLEALRINPSFTAVDKLMSRFTNYTKDNHHLKLMVEKTQDASLDENSQTHLYFALGKAYEDLEDYQSSFKHLEIGNQIKKKMTNYKSTHDLKIFHELISKFKDYKFSQDNNKKYKKQIIFIVGLPRSGTSLVEQIISSHSEVFGGGELKFLEDLILNNFYKNNNLDTFQKLTKDTDLIDNIRTKYYDYVGKISSSRNIITDKAPLNFRWIGFIKILFPNSKIIHCKRDPKDNCLSLYKNIFDENQNWTYNQDNLLNYYKNYRKLMSFWKKKLPNFIYECRYEDIIDNPNNKIADLIKFCDLEWEDQCLEFHKSERPIKTVSVAQANQPLYNTSISSNKNFEIFFKDLFYNLDNLS